MPAWSSATRLLGREYELETLRTFVTTTATEGSSLLIVGEAGVGKTALLDEAGAHAATVGARVLRSAGVEFEADVSFAGLHQLVGPLKAELPALRPDYQHAIGVALGFTEGSPADQLMLLNSVMALLERGAADGPLILLLDDLQWFDRASATLFGLLARRLAGIAAGFLGVVRTGEGSMFEGSGLRELAVGPLDVDAAVELLAEVTPELVPRMARRVIVEAEGNPLALIELSTGFASGSVEQLSGQTPVGRRLQLHFERIISSLPKATREQLLLTALDGSGSPFPAVSLDQLQPAEHARLVRIHQITHGIQFRHPLTRSAVVELSTDEERRRAHRQLADWHPAGSERRAWHFAQAAIGPDEQVARLLEDAALQTKGRGDPVGAIGLLLRAAELSPDPADNHRRAMFATYLGADITGDLTDPQLLAGEEGDGRSRSITAAVAAAAYMVNGGGDTDTINRVLLGALRNSAATVEEWDAPLIETVYVLQANCSFGSRADLVADYRAALERIGLEPPGTLDLLGDTFLEPARFARRSVRRLDDAIALIDVEADPAHAVRLAIAAMYVDRLAGCRGALRRVLDHGRAGGAIASAIKAFALLGFDGLLGGEWDATLELAQEGLEYTARYHYRLLGGFLQYDQAMIAAARGQEDRVRALTDELIGWGAPNRVGFVLQLASHAKALSALSRGDFAAAYEQLADVCAPRTLPSHKPAALWMLLDLVEAAVRAGRIADARAHVADIDASGIAAISPRLALVAAGSAALVGPERGFREAFDKALAIPGSDRWPFHLARIRLAYGERLRRAKATIEARTQLGDALDVFQRMGAVPWAARARTELRASGAALSAQVLPEAAAMLTPQQQEIAELAAAGLTNKQIGERLFLSPRTVAAHLYQLFPKLGVSSRAALRDAIGSHSDSP